MQPTAEESKEDLDYAKRMLARADRILASVDESFIIHERGHKVRQMPTFRPEEISLGPVLGMGGFGIVHEIRKFSLDPDPDDKAENGSSASAVGNGGNTTKTTTPQQDTAPDAAHSSSLKKPDDSDNDGKSHYDIRNARQVMQVRATKNGTARYALKRLHGALTELERTRGMIDMALEAKYLAVVWHPNIIKMRGMASGPMVDKDFFIILDRLYETLDKRMNQWHVREKKNHRAVLGLMGKNKKAIREMMIERMTIAYDLAAAFFYLHENRLVYRDIKPENIGFDLRGDVKVFDFGLCKNLSPKLKAREGGYGYRLTGRAGSLPYMAPEVARMETYDTKCDVFSFAILLWEMLSCRPAFDAYSSAQFMEKVVIEKERLPVQKTWPPLSRLMLPEAWENDPRKRPDMKRVAILIRADLNDLCSDESVLHRTKHMENRSQHSFSGEEGE